MAFIQQNPTDASLTPTRTFIPRLDSALHIRSPPSTRQTPSRQTYQRLPSPNSDRADVISVYTADADGDVDDEAVVEQTLLAINSPTKEPEPRQSPERHSIATPIWDDLFGPEPSPVRRHRSATPQSTTRRRRIVMSHVLVPPFTKPKHSYTRMFRRKKATRPAEDPHVNVALALQACFQNNHDLDIPLEQSGKPKQKVKPLPPSARAKREVHMTSTSHIKTASSKRRIILSEDEGEEEHIPPKRRRLDSFIDLTISEDDELLARPCVVHHQRAPPDYPKIITIPPHTPISPMILACNLLNTFSQATQKLFYPPDHLPPHSVAPSRRRCTLVNQEWLDEQVAIEDFAAVFDNETNNNLYFQDGSSSAQQTSTAANIDLDKRFRQEQTVSLTAVKTQSTLQSAMSADGLDEEDRDGLPPKPSAKALGKRKAMDPITHLPTPSSLSSTTGSSPQSPQPGLRTTGTGDIFINSFNPSPSHGSMSIHDDAVLMSTGPPRNREPHTFAEYEKDRTMLSTSLSRHRSSTQLQDEFSLVDTVLDDGTGLGSHESWSLFLEDQVVRSYTLDTINPLLLGSADPPVAFEATQEDDPMTWTSYDDPQPPVLTASGSSLHSSTPASPAASSSTSKSGPLLAEEEMRRRSPSPLILPAPHVGPPPCSPPRFWLSGSVIPKRQRKQRLMKDMVAVEDVVSSSVESSRATTEGYDNSDDGSTVLVMRPTQTLRVTAESESFQSRFLDRMFEKSGGEAAMFGGQRWPKGTTIFCHQCRSKPAILKLVCPECNKSYCVRCLCYRYQNEARAFDMDTSSCPSCSGYCNCTSCCQKRGIVYVPFKRHPRPRKSTAPGMKSEDHQSNRPRFAPGGKTNLPPLIASNKSSPVNEEFSLASAPRQPSPGPRVYWSTIYGLNGTKIGTTFAASNTTVGPPDRVYATTPSNPIPSSSKRSPVVWVGKIQPSWGLGNVIPTKELDPTPHAKHKKAFNHRAYPIYCEPRMYIGKRSPLFSQSEAAAKELADLSDLTDMEDEESSTWEYSHGVVATTTQFSADSLTEQDITRAIELALAVCGIPVLK